MKKVVLMAILLVVISLSQGCSNAGPFVTDISSDGDGNLLITKNTIVFDSILGVVKDGNHPIVYKIKVFKN